MEFSAQKDVFAIKQHPEWMVVNCCAAVEAIKREYDMSKKSANVDSFGVVMSNVKCAIIGERSTFVIKENEKHRRRIDSFDKYLAVFCSL